MTPQTDNKTQTIVKPESMKTKNRIKSLAVIGTVREWSNGGAYVKVPDHLIGMEVIVIPKGNIENVTVNVTGITETVDGDIDLRKRKKSQ